MASPPTWLSSFVDAVTANFHSHDVMPPLGCHFQKVDQIWEVTVFASRTEIIGGSQDGRVRHAPFAVDVKNLLDSFTTVDQVSWQTQRLGQCDDLGAHLSVEGLIEDQPVWLRITAISPERFDFGRRAYVNQCGFEDAW